MSQANLQLQELDWHVGNRRLIGMLTCLVLVFVGRAAVAQAIEATPTDAEQRWVDRMLTYFADGEQGKPLIDQRHLTHVALKPYGLKQETIAAFEQIDYAWLMLDAMRNTMEDTSGLVFLRMTQRDGQRKALFRITDITGLSYIEWCLKDTDDGEVIAWDADAYTAGEHFSQTLRRMWITAIIEFEPEFAKHMGKRNRTMADHFHEITNLRKARGSGDYEKAIDIYHAMPSTLRDENVCMIHALVSYTMLEQYDEYVVLLERYNKLHAAASNQELMAIDLFLLREDYENTLRLIDALDRRVGGDPYLDLFRSTVAYEQGDYKKAQALIDSGLGQDAGMLDFYWNSIEIAVLEEDWPRVSQMLDGIQQQGLELYPLSEVDFYASYLATEEYQRWLSKQSKEVQAEQRGCNAVQDEIKAEDEA